MRGWSHMCSFSLLCSNLLAHRWKPLVSEDSSPLTPGPSTPSLSWKHGMISKTKLSYRWTAAVQTNHMWAVCKFSSHLLSMGPPKTLCIPSPFPGNQLLEMTRLRVPAKCHVGTPGSLLRAPDRWQGRCPEVTHQLLGDLQPWPLP